MRGEGRGKESEEDRERMGEGSVWRSQTKRGRWEGEKRKERK